MAAALEEGLSPTTVHHLHAVLHKAMDQAIRWGLVVRNVLELVDPARMARTEMRTLSPKQARHFLVTARGDRFEALWVLALTTGMRQGELLALRWRDVDLAGGSLAVTGTLQRVPGQGLTITEPKTLRSRRRILLVVRGKSS